jgi:voltage-gated potassium channel
VSHRAALVTIAAASVTDTGLGLAFGAADHIGPWRGLYFAVTTATTVGYGDLTAHGWAAHLLAVAMMLLVVPLFAAAFSLFTSGLTAAHVRSSEKRIKAHLEERLTAHHKALAAGHPTAKETPS